MQVKSQVRGSDKPALNLPFNLSFNSFNPNSASHTTRSTRFTGNVLFQCHLFHIRLKQSYFFCVSGIK